jgi:hypothetical protein
MTERVFRGERDEVFTLIADRENVTGVLCGDDILARIADGELPPRLVLSQAEYESVRTIWLEETGQPLAPFPHLLLLELLTSSATKRA